MEGCPFRPSKFTAATIPPSDGHRDLWQGMVQTDPTQMVQTDFFTERASILNSMNSILPTAYWAGLHLKSGPWSGVLKHFTSVLLELHSQMTMSSLPGVPSPPFLWSLVHWYWKLGWWVKEMGNPSWLGRTLLSDGHARDVPIFSQLNLFANVAPPCLSTAWHSVSCPVMTLWVIKAIITPSFPVKTPGCHRSCTQSQGTSQPVDAKHESTPVHLPWCLWDSRTELKSVLLQGQISSCDLRNSCQKCWYPECECFRDSTAFFQAF